MPSPSESDPPPPPPEEESRPTPADDALDGADDDDDDDDDDDHPRGEEALRRRVMALSKLIGLPAATDEARDARCSARIHRGRLLLAEAVSVTSRDARSSELRPLLGTDPDTLSQMALSDAAEALAHAPGHEDAHMLRIRAAERAAPNDVRRFVIEALAFFPGHEGLLKTLSGLPGSDTVTKRVRPETAADRDATKPGDEDDEDDVAPELECVLCLKLLHVPVTTPCGHSFCKHCLASALDHSRARQQCPLCRAPLHMSVADHAPTVSLQSIIERIYPERCARRAAEVRRLTTGGGGGGGSGSAEEITVPLFVVGVMFPGHSARFNIFEPRYRLMMRRCLDGSRTFGVVQHVSPGDDNARHAFGNDDENGGSFSAVGCLVRIVDCQVQPDGRLVMTVQGEKRFRVVRSWETDGYRVADVRVFRDADARTAEGPGANDDDAGSEVETGADEASTFAASSAAGTLAATQELATMLRAALVDLLPREAAGQLPSLSEPEPTAAEMERLSLWGCGAVAGAAGLDQLASTSTAARLQFCIDRIPERRPRCSPM